MHPLLKQFDIIHKFIGIRKKKIGKIRIFILMAYLFTEDVGTVFENSPGLGNTKNRGQSVRDELVLAIHGVHIRTAIIKAKIKLYTAIFVFNGIFSSVVSSFSLR